MVTATELSTQVYSANLAFAERANSAWQSSGRHWMDFGLQTFGSDLADACKQASDIRSVPFSLEAWSSQLQQQLALIQAGSHTALDCQAKLLSDLESAAFVWQKEMLDIAGQNGSQPLHGFFADFIDGVRKASTPSPQAAKKGSGNA